MKRKLCLTLAAAALALSATSVRALTIEVNFSFDNAGTGVAFGAFTYDDSLYGSILSFANLNSFILNIPGAAASYDLAFLNSASPSEYNYMAFDTNSNTFLPMAIGDFSTTLLSAVNDPLLFDAGFLLDGDSFFGLVYNHPEIFTLVNYWDSSTITTAVVPPINGVPEPGTLTLFLLGFAGMAFAGRRREAVLRRAA